ncbi:hypothetical protein [Polaribacter sp. HaHaR_3_91]|uniref:hypothetical protein n=1 Tax=Polaribacter sp. HaHaR_3_91 TaxID=2745561 RepID=UPI001C4F71AE|nr:hypothetical protein [Polaribacter sp. HaHaR_3_91]QXP63233.1 hypothetical protein H0I27_15495 [Polaribacter sp. HaHaR_3_91]
MNDKRKQLCLNYLKAQKAFLDIANDDEVLRGKDNIIGRIGEAIAHFFLEQIGRYPKVIKKQSNPSYDITCKNGAKRVSVKMITSENKTGNTSKIHSKWDELIGIELGEDFKILKLGIINKENFDKEQTKRNKSLTPSFSRAKLKENGVFNITGRVYDKKDLEKYNLI